MKYKPGDKVRIKSLDWYNKNKDEDGRVYCTYIGFCKEMAKYCGKILTIMTIANQDIGTKQKYFMHETDYAWGFTDEMIEGLADESQDKMVSLDKACKYLEDVLYEVATGITCEPDVMSVESTTMENFINNFRKAMEE